VPYGIQLHDVTPGSVIGSAPAEWVAFPGSFPHLNTLPEDLMVATVVATNRARTFVPHISMYPYRKLECEVNY